jgi:L-threonylcarbamoyladenylate synthase
VLLRPGAITPQAIFDKLHVRVQPAATATSATAAPQAPGTLLAHYAPRAKLRIMEAKDMQAALDLLGNDAPAIGIWSRTPLRSNASKVRLATMPGNAEEAARELFARLRAFDEQGMTLIWVEPVSTAPEWEAVADRLRRAAAA